MQERALHYLYRAGEAHERENRYEEAEKAYRELTDKAKEWDLADWSSTGLWRLGIMHQRQGSLDQAVAFYEKAFTYRERARAEGAELRPEGDWMLLDNLKQTYLLQARMNLAQHTHWRMEDHAIETIGWAPVEVEDGLPYDSPPPLEAEGERELFAALILNENRFRLLQGEMTSAIRRLKRLAAELEKIGERSFAANSLLVRAYSEQITLMEYTGRFDEIDEVAAKIRGMPDDPWSIYFKAAVQVRMAHLRVKRDPEAFDASWSEAQEGIRILEQEGHSMMALYTRRYLPMMLAGAGRQEEAWLLMEELTTEAKRQDSPGLPTILSTRARMLGGPGAEAGRDQEFVEVLRQHWGRANIMSVPYVYRYYARYLHQVGARAEAEAVAQLGLRQTDMFEELKVRRDLEAMLEEWRGSSEPDGVFDDAAPVVQSERVGSAKLPTDIGNNAFGFLDIAYAFPGEDRLARVNFRARTTRPMRLEFFDPRDNRLIAIDADGNGEFSGKGEIAFRDSRRDGYPELDESHENGRPILMTRIYPFSSSEEYPDANTRVTLEIQRDGRWEKWAETRLLTEEDLSENPNSR